MTHLLGSPGNTGRLVLLSTSPRVAPGLLTLDAWTVLRQGQVLVGDAAHPLLPYLGAADISVTVLPAQPAAALAARLISLSRGETVVWLVGPDGDAALGVALAAPLGSATDAPSLEVLPGSYDLPGARLIDVVAVMDRLRSPGGCPWDAEQTHASLLTYLLEETYEAIEAIETGDGEHLREELGDLLLQVVFHARIAQDGADGWAVDDVAGDLVDKLVRRHPHVFGPAGAHLDGPAVGPSPEHLERTWDAAKAAEKGRTSATDGVPMSLPALSLAAKLIGRARRAGIEVTLPPDDRSIGSRLLALAAEAQQAGRDPESELRAAARAYAEAVRAAETRASRATDGDIVGA